MTFQWRNGTQLDIETDPEQRIISIELGGPGGERSDIFAPPQCMQ